MIHYWLMKSEPQEFSIDDLMQAPKQITAWEGVRNYQARNFMRDSMHASDLVYFYHSNCDLPGIVGIAKIVRESYADPSQFDAKSAYFDAKSNPQQPRWFCVNVQFVEKFPKVISLSALKNNIQLQDFALIRKGNRLSVLPVSQQHWNLILSLSRNE